MVHSGWGLAAVVVHYIEADLREGWVLAGLIRLELYLAKHAKLNDLYPETDKTAVHKP